MTLPYDIPLTPNSFPIRVTGDDAAARGIRNRYGNIEFVCYPAPNSGYHPRIIVPNDQNAANRTIPESIRADWHLDDEHPPAMRMRSVHARSISGPEGATLRWLDPHSGRLVQGWVWAVDMNGGSGSFSPSPASDDRWILLPPNMDYGRAWHTVDNLAQSSIELRPARDNGFGHWKAAHTQYGWSEAHGTIDPINYILREAPAPVAEDQTPEPTDEHVADINKISAYLSDLAQKRGFCSEYDDLMRTLNRDLTVKITPRMTTVQRVVIREVRSTVQVQVPEGASDDDIWRAAREQHGEDIERIESPAF